MQINNSYDVAIVGGGLAGLAASIQLARANHSVILFEKEKYPFHKVCGEYVSLESWNFLQQLGLPLNDMSLPTIDTLQLTAPNGTVFNTKLPLGGFGISRHKLDGMLADIARRSGVTIAEETRIDDVRFDGAFELGFKSQKTTAKVCCAAYGKRSNLDIKWKRSFSANANKRLNNYVGVKYHIQTDWPKNIIGLHNFSNGYCGISKIEENNYCLCFMTKADNLRKSFNNIDQLQNEILCRNPHLSKIFSNSDFSSEFPVTISQISFQKKTQVENHVLMIGDAGGMITPLCGNGMSIALHTAKIAAALADDFLCGRISRDQLENFYKSQWTHHFSKRLRSGRILQQFFGSDRLSNLFVSTFRKFPFLSKPIIKMTHGKPF